MSKQEIKSGSLLKAIGMATILVIIISLIGTITATILGLKMKYSPSNVHDADTQPPKEPKSNKDKEESKTE